jgi:hypothetical protein
MFSDRGTPEFVWYVLAAHTLLGMIVIFFYTKTLGEFKELEA